MSPGIYFFSSKGLLALLLDESFLCKCDGCAQRKASGGMTFMLIKENAWLEHLTVKQMKTRFETLNPCIGVSEELLAPNIRDCLSEGKWAYEVDRDTNRLSASFVCDSEEFSLDWRLEAHQAPIQMVMYHLVSPLFLALEQSTKREANLCKSLERVSQRLQLSGITTINKHNTGPPLVSSDDTAKSTESELTDDQQTHGFTITAAVIKSFSHASIALKPQLEIPRESISSDLKPTVVPPASKVAKVDQERQRHEELQRKLARELEKSKTKRSKKSGILRK